MSNTYSTYVTTWVTGQNPQPCTVGGQGTDPLVQIQDMISKSVLQSGTRVILAFASFNF